MEILKKENWWVWILLFIFSGNTSMIVLGALLGVYNKKAWYTKWYWWLIGLIFIIPFCIMTYVFMIQITSLTAAKLGVSGKELYLSPYIWIILLIIPILGWILFCVMYIYLIIDILIKLHDGEGEKYIKQK